MYKIFTMKYKLINKQTNEEHLCDKVTIDGFDYYVSDTAIGYRYGISKLYEVVEIKINYDATLYKGIICSTNPNIDIPKVVCNIDLTKLCYYDRRNPDFSIKEEYGYDKEEVEATGNFAKKDCACDNCFYGRSQLTEQLIKSQETHPFSEEDMIEFANWIGEEWSPNGRKECWDSNELNSTHEPKYLVDGTKELLQIWKEQKPKIVYYE